MAVFRKILLILLILALCGGAALAEAPWLDEQLFDRGKDVLGLLAYGEYEKAFEKAEFSDDSLTVDDFTNEIQQNFFDLFTGTVQREVAVFVYDVDFMRWTLYIPVLPPSGEHGEVLVLHSADGQRFDGYGCVDWSEALDAAYAYHEVIWNEEYSSSVVLIQTDQ